LRFGAGAQSGKDRFILGVRGRTNSEIAKKGLKISFKTALDLRVREKQDDPGSRRKGEHPRNLYALLKEANPQ